MKLAAPKLRKTGVWITVLTVLAAGLLMGGVGACGERKTQHPGYFWR